MLKRIDKSVWFFTLVVLGLAALVFDFHPASADINDNVRGIAYNATYGDISFNCLDDTAGGHFPYTFPFSFFVPACSSNTHGVNINSQGNFSGEAWNDGLGEITFYATSTPPDNYAFAANCPNTCNLANNCTACYRESDQKIYGWAKVLSTGEWWRFDGAFSPQAAISSYISPNPGIFSGYASSSAGAISLNCSNDSSCATRDYKVYRWPLEVHDLSAPNWSFSQSCDNGALKSVMKWNITSGTQSAYQVLINTSNSTSSPFWDSGKIIGSARQYMCPNSLDGCALNYNTHYYFWVRLWDEDNATTSWRQYNTGLGDTLTDNSAGNASSADPSLTYTTYSHEFPVPYFTWDPIDVLVGTTTVFSGTSQYYTNAQPNTNPQACSYGPCAYLWTTTDLGAIIASSTYPNTNIVFAKATNTSVTLKSTDPDGYHCSTSTLLNVNFVLPIWKEIKPHNSN